MMKYTTLIILSGGHMEHICNKCLKSKASNNFSKNNSRKNGLYAFCKTCDKEMQDAYRKTKNGLIAKIYSKQKSSAKKRGMDTPNYTSHELTIKLINYDKFCRLFDLWTKSQWKKHLTPSIDRIE